MRTMAVIVVGLALLGTMVNAGDLLPVWNMDTGLLNNQGGVYNHFAGGGSAAKVQLVSDIKRGPNGRAMKVTFRKNSSGFCGVWIHLFDDKATKNQRTYIDTIEYPYLSFWTRGAKGGEDFIIQMADPEWIAKEDSKPAGAVSKYLGSPLTTEWQEVVVPAKAFRLHDTRAAGITFNMKSEGTGAVFIDDICFKKTFSAAVPMSKTAKAPQIKVTRKKPLARAMWVWETEELLSDPRARKEFFVFCKKQRINELFLQVLYSFKNDMTANVTCELNKTEQLKSFIRIAHARGIKIHAMDGFPEFVLRPHHPRVLALVQAIVDFNAAAKPNEQFHGIHLDNEPYQLLGFESPLQEQILREYLELNEQIMSRLIDNDLVYGVDIPFWFDEREDDPHANCLVKFNGVKKNAAEHIIDIVDNVGIMDYRDFAGGADGMIRHAEGELKYAEKQGKKIYLGVETFKYDPTKVSILYGMPRRKWQRPTKKVRKLLLSSQVDGFKVRCLQDDKNFYPALAWPKNADKVKMNRALRTLYRTLGGPDRGNHLRMEAQGRDMIKIMRESAKYDGMQMFFAEDQRQRVIFAGWSTTENMPDKVTFAGKKKSYLEEVLREVDLHFRENDSLHGFAIHYYSTFKAMAD